METAWERVRQALADLRVASAAAGARLLVVQASSRGPDMDARLAAACEEVNVPLHSLLGPLRAAPGPVLFAEDGHWRGRGHLVASLEIAPLVASLLAGPDSGATVPLRP